jgi:uncharacterized protein YegP (UPF0339 family)
VGEDAVRLTIYQAKPGKGKGRWRWKITGKNGKILANGGEGYVRRVDLLNALSRIDDHFSALDWESLEKP